jgi:hypothetical protein
MVEPAQVPSDTDGVARITQWWLASLAMLVIFIIFVHPATVLLPATYSQHFPFLQSLLIAVSGLVLPPVVLSPIQTIGTHMPQLCECSERLALICTRLC